MEQLQTADVFGHSFALAQIASYRTIQAEHREALDLIDKGIRHFDAGPNGMVETTDQFRQRRLAAIADLERWVRMWERDLIAGE